MIYIFLGNALLELEKYKEASIMYERAIEINPNYCAAYSNMGKKCQLFLRDDTK